MKTENNTARSAVSYRLIVTFAVFVVLGLPEGVLGTAWPSIRASFDRPVSGLASVITAYVIGYLLSTLVSGRLTESLGTNRAITVGVGLTLAGLVGYVITPTWAPFLVSAWVLGTGAGIVDSVINSDVALRYGQRAMHLLHASFGVGATVGPLLVAVLLDNGASWRVAYGLLAFIEAGLLLAVWTIQKTPETATWGESGLDVAYSRPRFPGVASAAMLVYFFFYVGVEVSVGQWSFSVLTEARGLSTAWASLAVASYWGGLTAGRFALGWVGDLLDPVTLLRASMVMAILAASVFLLNETWTVLALPVLGFAFAGVFPSLVLLTPRWLGRDRVVRAVGYQLAASSAGAIASSWAVGSVARRVGLGEVPMVFWVLTVLLAASHVLAEWAAQPASLESA